MPAWKQFLLSLAVVACGAAAWAAFFPGSSEVLAQIGLGAEKPPVAQAASAPRSMTPATSRIVTTPVSSGSLDTGITAMGSGKSASSAPSMPLGAGTVVSVTATPGSEVEKGQEIARLDSESEEIALRKAEAAVTDAETRFERARKLHAAQVGAIVQVEEAETTLVNARLAADEARLALARRSVVAPISGTIGLIHVQEGEQVTTQTEVAVVEDRSSIIVDFWVHESHAVSFGAGSPVRAVSPAWPGVTFEGTVMAIDGRIDETSRTIQAQAHIPNMEGRLRAGMSFKIYVDGTGQDYASVDPLAIQWSSDGPYVWAVRDGKAEKAAIGIVSRKIDHVLVTGDIEPGSLVVTEGVHSVRQGMAVTQ